MPQNTQFPISTIEQAVRDIQSRQPFVTTTDIAEEVGCTSETARNKLIELTNQDLLVSRRVGARAKVWFAPQWVTLDSAESSTRQSPDVPGDSSVPPSEPATSEPIPDTSETAAQNEPESTAESVLFFPSRREIVVDSPTDKSQQILARTAHLIDSTGDGYLYKTDETDIWNAPYDSFSDLRSDLIKLIGEDQWDGGFESRIHDDWERAHQFYLRTHSDGYTILEARDVDVFENVAKRNLDYGDHYTEFLSDIELRVTTDSEAAVKETLYEEGYPVIDQRRLEEGATLHVQLTSDITLRDYQEEWVEQFEARRAGVFVGPSGSGKTIAALGAMERIGGETLIIVPNRELAQQWTDELLEKTSVRRGQIGQYHGGTKQIRPVTIATYDIASMSRHRELFNERDWGLIIADECHHSVASTWKRFREIQSKARLGLSATPVREADDPKEIYTLIGPPIGTDWGSLFADGWVEKPSVELIAVPWASDTARDRYQRASGSKQLIEAARNSRKIPVIDSLLDDHSDQKTLIFVDWIRQGKELASELDLPFVYGETSHDKREEMYEQFRAGEISALIVSRVGDEGIDLPDAEIAVLASTMGSSRSQTGQRAGRTMRPLGDATVYIILTKGSGEEDWGRESTQYLAEKGVDVTKTDWEALSTGG